MCVRAIWPYDPISGQKTISPLLSIRESLIAYFFEFLSEIIYYILSTHQFDFLRFKLINFALHACGAYKTNGVAPHR